MKSKSTMWLCVLIKLNKDAVDEGAAGLYYFMKKGTSHGRGQ